MLDTYKPDLALVGYPGTDEIQHQFLGLVTRKLPNGAPNPAYDDVEVNGTPDGRVKQREAFIRDAYESADATMRLAQEHMRDRDLTTFVVLRPRLRAAVRGDRRQQGARRPRPAVAPADRQLPPGHRETIGKAKACFAGGALQIYLNLAGRDPAAARRPIQQVAGRRRGEHGRRRSGPPSSRCRTPTTGPATASPRAGR